MLEIHPSDSLTVPSFATRNNIPLASTTPTLGDRTTRIATMEAVGKELDYAGFYSLNTTTNGGTNGTNYDATLLTGSLVNGYRIGQKFRVRFHVACNANPTLNIEGLGDYDLKTESGGSISAGDLVTNRFYMVEVNSIASTQIRVQLSEYIELRDAIDTKADLASPTFTGTPRAPTLGAGNNGTGIATTAFVQGELGDKADLASPALTGNPTAPTQSAGNSSTRIATTAFVQGEKASPAFTGNPTAPTQTAGNSSTRLATTAFVESEVVEARERPGDAPGMFIQEQTGEVTAGTAMSGVSGAAVVNDTAMGRSLGITNVATSVAQGKLVSIASGRVYRTRFRFKRVTNPSDPLNDGVDYGVRFLQYDKTGVAGGTGTRTIATLALTVSDGVQAPAEKTFSLDVSGVDYTIPSGTVYARAFVRMYGTDHVTRVAEVDLEDVTDAFVGLPGIAQRDSLLDLDGTSGTSSAYTASLYNGTLTKLVDGQKFIVRFHTANDSSPTLNIDSLGAVPMYMDTGGMLDEGDIKPFFFYIIKYFASGGGSFRVWSAEDIILRGQIDTNSTDIAALYALIDELETTNVTPFPLSVDRLLGNRTYYVRADGSDSNNGLTNTSGGAFRQISKALTTIKACDLNGFTVQVLVGDGTYGAFAAKGRWVGDTADEPVTIIGNTGTPGNVVISASSDHAVSAQYGARLTVKGMKVTTSSAGAGILAYYGSIVLFHNIEFGDCANDQILCGFNSDVVAKTDYLINGDAETHIHCTNSSTYYAEGRTITLSGTPAFSSEFAGVNDSYISFNGSTFSGSATGKRYFVHYAGVIVAGQGTDSQFLPGSTMGECDDGGTYNITPQLYTPTASNTVNCAVTPSQFMVSRNGDMVHCCGVVVIDAVTGNSGGNDTDTSFDLTLPLASGVTNSADISGTMVLKSLTTGQTMGWVEGNTVDKLAHVRYLAKETASKTAVVNFTYFMREIGS